MLDERLRVSVEGENNLGPAINAAGAAMSGFAQKVASDAAALSSEFERLANKVAGVGTQAARTGEQVAVAQQRVYGSAQTAVSQYTNVQTEATEATYKSEVATASFAAGVKNLGGSFLTMFAGLYSGQAAVRFLVGSFKEFLAMEAGVSALSASIEVIGGDVETLSAKSEDAISRFEQLSSFDDDEIRAALGGLITITGDFDASLVSVQGALDLAAARGMDLASAATLIGKAIEGNIVGLGRLGIQLSDSDKKVFEFGTEVERATVLLDRLEESMGGRAEKALSTHAAQIKRLGNDWGDFKEEMGGHLAVAMDWIDRYGRKLNEFRDRHAANFLGGLSLFPLFPDTYAERPPDVFPETFGPPKPPGYVDPADAERARQNAAAEEARQAALKASKKAAEAAAQAERDYQRALENLIGIGPEVARSQRMVSDAIGRIDDQTGLAGAGLFAMRSHLQQIADTAALTGGSLRRDLLPYIEQLVQFLPQIPTGQSLGGFLQPLPTQTRLDEIRSEIALKVTVPEIELTPAAMRDLGTQFGRAVSPGLADALSDVALTGGRNLGDIMGQAFQERVRAGADEFVGVLGTVFADLFGGRSQRIVERGGRFFIRGQEGPPFGGFDTQQEAFASTSQGRAQRGVGLAFGALQVGAGAYEGGRMGETSLLGATLGGAVSGFASGGGWLGAIVGAVIGLIGSALGNAARYASFEYGQFGIEDGQAFFRGNENVTANRARGALAQLQQTWNDLYAGYFDILMTFPDQLATGILANMGDVEPEIGLPGGDIGRAASANFWKHFDEYLRSGMPDQIAEQFFDSLSDSFERYGMDPERFRQIWSDLDALDPHKQMELLGILARAVVGFFETLEYFRTPVFQAQGDFAPSAAPGGLLQQAWIRNHESFADALAREDQELIRLGGTLSELTGEAQIRQAGRLADMLRERQALEEEFFRRLAQTIENVNASLDQFLLGIDLEQMVTPGGEPDWEARIARMQTEGENVWNRLMQASSPEEVEHWSQEWIRINQQILGMAQNLGPEAYQQYLSWVEENTLRFRVDVAARFQQLGQDVEDANARFLAAFEGFIDAFNEAVDRLDGGETPGPPGDRPEPEPQPLPDSQMAVFQESNTSLSEISDYSSQIVAELVAIRAQLEAGRNTPTSAPQSVRLHHTVTVDAPDGYRADVISRRLLN